MQISAGPKKDFLTHPTIPHPPAIKAPPKIPHRVHNIRIEKQIKYSILIAIKLGPPVWESSTRSQNFMVLTDSEHKFHKMVVENWLPIGFNLRSSWLENRSHNHIK